MTPQELQSLRNSGDLGENAGYTINELQERVRVLHSALEKIAAPMRPDGTWNRDRAACQQIAVDALERVK